MTDQREALREAAQEVIDAADAGFGGFAIRIPNPGQRRSLIRATEHLRDALAALPSTPQPEMLDVERLARALSVQSDPKPDDPRPLWDIISERQREQWRSRARLLATEYARLAPPPPEPPLKDTFWLVERGQPEGVNPPVYYATHASRTKWTPSAGLAVRFDSKADADLFIDHQLGGTPIVARAVEHAWLAPPPPTGANR